MDPKPSGRRRLGLAVIGSSLMLTALLAGCFGGETYTDPLLQDSAQVGESMFGWGDARHFVGPDTTRNITAGFELPTATESLGVSFQGSFLWRNSTTWLELIRPDGSMALHLRAEEGMQDDVGPIATLFEFHRLVAVDDTGPGKWNVTAGGRGNISSLDFRVHAISAEATQVTRTFSVPADDLPLRLDVNARGWGSVPTGVVEAPDGTTSQVALSGPRGEGHLEWTGQAGNHTLTMDTTGWGGRMSLQVVPR